MARHGIADPLVALTFDDGPSQWTDPILDELGRHGGRGTFFVVGNAIEGTARRRTLQRAVDEGHELGNHTYAHPDLQNLAPDDIREEMRRAQALIEETAGVSPLYWRAPFFHSGPAVRSAVGDLAGREVWYSCMPGDWALPAHATAALVLDGLQPGDIVVLHDGRPDGEPAELSWPTRDATVEAVGHILAAMSERGLRSVTISDFLAAR